MDTEIINEMKSFNLILKLDRFSNKLIENEWFWCIFVYFGKHSNYWEHFGDFSNEWFGKTILVIFHSFIFSIEQNLHWTFNAVSMFLALIL